VSIFETRARSASPPPVINVTPLIDVLLVLLIIFMVIQPLNEATLPVKAPAPLVDAPPMPETLMLTVSSEMRLELNSTPLEVPELMTLLGNVMEQRAVEDRSLFIKAPPFLEYGAVVLLIDLAKGAGVVTIGLVQNED
jgi:biopolymer transport protein ExbD